MPHGDFYLIASGAHAVEERRVHDDPMPGGDARGKSGRHWGKNVYNVWWLLFNLQINFFLVFLTRALLESAKSRVDSLHLWQNEKMTRAEKIVNS